MGANVDASVGPSDEQISNSMYEEIARKKRKGTKLSPAEQRMFNAATPEQRKQFGLPNVDMTLGSEDNPYLGRELGRPDRPELQSPYVMEPTGEYNDYGEPIMRPKTRTVHKRDASGQMQTYNEPVIRGDLEWKEYERLNWSEDYAANPWQNVEAGSVADDMSWMDKRASEDMYNIAREAGPSQWAKLAEDKQRMEQLQAREDMMADMSGQLAGARSQLAMRGGLGSGARERLATAGARSINAEQQRLARQGQLARLGIGIEDQARKDRMLGAAAQSQLGYSGLEGNIRTSDADRILRAGIANSQGISDISKFNAGQKMGLDVGQKDREYTSGVQGLEYRNKVRSSYNQDELDKYIEEMKDYGAGRTADEIRRA